MTSRRPPPVPSSSAAPTSSGDNVSDLLDRFPRLKSAVLEVSTYVESLVTRFERSDSFRTACATVSDHVAPREGSGASVNAEVKERLQRHFRRNPSFSHITRERSRSVSTQLSQPELKRSSALQQNQLNDRRKIVHFLQHSHRTAQSIQTVMWETLREAERRVFEQGLYLEEPIDKESCPYCNRGSKPATETLNGAIDQAMMDLTAETAAERFMEQLDMCLMLRVEKIKHLCRQLKQLEHKRLQGHFPSNLQSFHQLPNDNRTRLLRVARSLDDVTEESIYRALADQTELLYKELSQASVALSPTSPTENNEVRTRFTAYFEHIRYHFPNSTAAPPPPSSSTSTTSATTRTTAKLEAPQPRSPLQQIKTLPHIEQLISSRLEVAQQNYDSKRSPLARAHGILPKASCVPRHATLDLRNGLESVNDVLNSTKDSMSQTIDTARRRLGMQ